MWGRGHCRGHGEGDVGHRAADIRKGTGRRGHGEEDAGTGDIGQGMWGRGHGAADTGEGTSGQGTWGCRYGEEDVGKVTRGRAGGAAGDVGVEFPPTAGTVGRAARGGEGEGCGHAVWEQNWDHPSEDLGFPCTDSHPFCSPDPWAPCHHVAEGWGGDAEGCGIPVSSPAADSPRRWRCLRSVCWLLFALTGSEWFLIIDASFSFYLVLAAARKGLAFLH